MIPAQNIIGSRLTEWVGTIAEAAVSEGLSRDGYPATVNPEPMACRAERRHRPRPNYDLALKKALQGH